MSLARRSTLVLPALAALALAGCPEGSGTSGSGTGAGGAATVGGGGSGGATTTSTTSTTTTTMTVPLTCPDAVTVPPISGGECDLLQQNCAPGETCEPTVDGTSTFCRKEGGLKGPGKPCSLGAGADECQAGLFCIGPQDGVGFCTRPCCQTNDEPCSGGDCNTEVNFPGGLTVFMCSYSEQCTLFTPGQCKNGQKCQFVYPAQGLAVCTLPSPNSVPDGGACQYVNECAEAAICYAGACHYNCKLNGGGDPGLGGCPSGQSCKVVYPDSDIGVCQD